MEKRILISTHKIKHASSPLVFWLDSAYSLSIKRHISMPDDLFLENHRVTHALLQVYFHSIKIRLLLTQFGKAERLIVMLVEK